MLEKILNDEKDTLKDVNRHVNKMIISLDNIKGDEHLHLVPNPLKMIRYFKRGFNGTYKKVQEYDKMRKDLGLKLTNTTIKYSYRPRKLYMYAFIKEPYSSNYPEDKIIRYTAHFLAHIELRYYIRRNLEEISPIYRQLKKKLGNDFVNPRFGHLHKYMVEE